MLRLFRETGYKPSSWEMRLNEMSSAELNQLVRDAEEQQAIEEQLAECILDACDGS